MNLILAFLKISIVSVRLRSTISLKILLLLRLRNSTLKLLLRLLRLMLPPLMPPLKKLKVISMRLVLTPNPSRWLWNTESAPRPRLSRLLENVMVTPLPLLLRSKNENLESYQSLRCLLKYLYQCISGKSDLYLKDNSFRSFFCIL